MIGPTLSFGNKEEQEKIMLDIEFYFNKETNAFEIIFKAISLDSLIIKKDASLILNNNLKSQDLSKKGIEFTAKFYNNNEETKYSFFNIPVESIEAILVDNKLISLEIRLEESNEHIEIVEKKFTEYFITHNKELSILKGSKRTLYYGEKDNYFMIDAFLITKNNMGSLSVGYITKKFIELDQKIKQNN